jgi:hypothetical protein
MKNEELVDFAKSQASKLKKLAESLKPECLQRKHYKRTAKIEAQTGAIENKTQSQSDKVFCR